MAKASFSAKDAVLVSLGIQAGNVEITGAVCKIHQYPPNKTTGKQGDPFPCVQLEFQQYDSKWEKLDEEPVKQEFGIGKSEKFHPGLAKSADDEDPEDLGDEVDVEGNCIAVVADGAHLNKKCKWIILTDSMEKLGFKPEILGNGFLPDLIGTRGHLKTIPQDKMPNSESDKEPTALVFDSISQFPYEKKGAGKSAAAKPGAKAPAPAAGKTAAKSAPAPAAASNTDDDEATAISTIQEIITELAGDDPVSLDVRALKSKVTAKLMRNKVPIGRHKSIGALVGDVAWLEAQADSQTIPMMWDGDESKVVFPPKED